MEDVAPLAAQSLFQHDVRHGMRNSLTTFSSIQDFLSLVEIGVACPAVCYGIDVLLDLVLDFHVALITFYFVFINMSGMQEICIIISLKSLLFPVAFVTVLPGDFTISNNGIAVAFVTGETVIKHQGVVITRRSFPNQHLFSVTVVTVVDLWIVLTLLEMTNKARTFGDGDVFSLDNLGMTACALKPFSSFKIIKMNFVVKGDFVELDQAFKEPFVMAALPEAAFVSNLCPGLGFDIEFGPVPSDHDQPFDLFPQFRLDAPARGIMAHAAFKIAM